MRKITTSRTASIQVEEDGSTVRGIGLPEGNRDEVAVEAIETLVELERDIDPLSNEELRHLARLLREDSEGNEKLAAAFSAYASMRENQARS